ncbi:MAG: GvpL/GvpF family gas vesicle protein [Phycisphaerae bacterium]|nr:GvpL/GvpF family gas vesicle protein [Phycisphaerae bacterium]
MSTATLTSEPRPAVEPDQQKDWGPRRYIYCITDCAEPALFGPLGLGNDSECFAMPYKGISAVVSRTPEKKFEISRVNTLRHQHVMEAVMERGYTVLPVRFDTIAEDKPDGSADADSRIVNHVLTKRLEEFTGLLKIFSGRVELGVKGLWTNMETVFGEIVRADYDIKRLRRRMLGTKAGKASGQREAGLAPEARLGELVKKALDAKKERVQRKLLKQVDNMIVDSRTNKTFGDKMFANLALLVKKHRQGDFGGALTKFDDERAGGVKLKYIGPVPPSNFIEIIITWDD